jgi:uncharacterized protein YndB with AHSA1/START domain/uncharacterized protein YciI
MKRSPATAVADVTEGVVLARIEIAVPPDRVFRALTTEELTRWWGADDLYRTTKFSIDLRPGGRWRTDGRGTDGSDFHVEGEVLEVDPPRRLVQTWKPSWEPGPATTITYTLDAVDGGTRVTVRHSGFTSGASCDSHADGWTRVLGWLGGHFAGDERYFLLRLHAPRPTFAMDMSADERELMTTHGNYLASKLAEGAVLAFGPVLDPQGAWGMAVVRAPDEAAARAISTADPVIAANRGFHYDVIPIARLVY